VFFKQYVHYIQKYNCESWPVLVLVLILILSLLLILLALLVASLLLLSLITSLLLLLLLSLLIHGLTDLHGCVLDLVNCIAQPLDISDFEIALKDATEIANFAVDFLGILLV